MSTSTPRRSSRLSASPLKSGGKTATPISPTKKARISSPAPSTPTRSIKRRKIANEQEEDEAEKDSEQEEDEVENDSGSGQEPQSDSDSSSEQDESGSEEQLSEYEEESESSSSEDPFEDFESSDEADDSDDSDFGQPRRKKNVKKKKTTLLKRFEEREARRAKRVQERLNRPKKPRPKLPLSTVHIPNVKSEDMTPFQRAKALLHVAATPEYLPCRDEEFAEIEAYLEDAVDEGAGCCIYIAGVPGTGKTATVKSVISSLKESVQYNELKDFKFLEINAMKLTEPNQVFPALWEFISDGQASTARHSLEQLDNYFSDTSLTKEPRVVLVDELDQLVTKSKQKQDVIYNLFDWPNRPNSELTVIAIANTMDLPEREFSGKVRSRLGSNRINFAPYKRPQLEEILKSRLQSIEGSVVDSSAISLCAAQAAKITGDARRALDVCRRTVERVERENTERAEEAQKQGLEAPAPKLVVANDINTTYKQMIGSGHSFFLKAASLHEKILLISLARTIRKSGVDFVEFQTVMRYHLKFCNQCGFNKPLPSHDILFSIIFRLATMRLVITESGKQDIWMKVSPNISDSDLLMVFKNDGVLGRFVGNNDLL